MPNERIAIIGVGCRFPGGVNDAESLWRFLVEAREGVVEVPADRWNVERYYDSEAGLAGKSIVRRGGFVDGIDHLGLVGEVAIGEFAGTALLGHITGNLANLGSDFLELGEGDGMFGVDGVGGGVFVVVFELVHLLCLVGAGSIQKREVRRQKPEFTRW